MYLYNIAWVGLKRKNKNNLLKNSLWLYVILVTLGDTGHCRLSANGAQWILLNTWDNQYGNGQTERRRGLQIVIWNINNNYFLDSVNTSYNNPASSYNVASYSWPDSIERLTLHHQKNTRWKRFWNGHSGDYCS